MPGLPRFHIMGLPDMAIKESQARIKSALRYQGFELPRHQQVLVNLKPLHLKKSSRGLDLAVACAYLWESRQVPLPPTPLDQLCIYGELSLEGRIQVPEDLEDMDEWDQSILSGIPPSPPRWHWLGAHELKELSSPQEFMVKKEPSPICYRRPPLEETYFTESQALLMKVVGYGEHSLWVAGPAGSGKTTLARNIHSVLSDPDSRHYRESRKMARSMGLQEEWRPFVAPHHSIPLMSMLGGGSPPVPGEISRAHGGILLLDELLEFHSYVRESLREPIESQSITVARRGAICHFPADFLLIATTNLCPCGDYIPQKPTHCHHTLTRCRSYLDKMSGPLLDRFAIISFSHRWRGDFKISLKEIREDIIKASEFSERTRRQSVKNSKLGLKELEGFVDEFVRENLLPHFSGSHRRKLAVFQVARSLADLAEQEGIDSKILNQALELCLTPFHELKFGFVL